MYTDECIIQPHTLATIGVEMSGFACSPPSAWCGPTSLASSMATRRRFSREVVEILDDFEPKPSGQRLQFAIENGNL